MNHSKYYSNGKLLISGEYLVLHGATAFAIPLKSGQSLEVEINAAGSNKIEWTSFSQGKIWFHGKFDKKTLKPLRSDYENYALKLSEILIKTRSLNAGFLMDDEAITVTTHLDFNIHWGLGSSSTLISNIAYWAHIDPFLLLEKTFGGSGYDIACARSNSALLYSVNQKYKPLKVHFNHPFFKNIYFAWLGKKQISSDEIRKFNQIKVSANDIETVTEISKKIINSENLDEFINCLRQNDEVISRILNQETIYNQFFSDFNGYIKNLGAWGGDFILVASNSEMKYVKNYLNKHGIYTIFAYDDLVLS